MKNMLGGFFRSLVIFSMASSICITSTHAEESSPDNTPKEKGSSGKEASAANSTKNFLLEAVKATEKASFKAVTTVYKNDKKQKDVILYRVPAKNGTVLEKVENIWPDARKESYISNEAGDYIFIGNSVMKSDFPVANWGIIYSSILQDNITEAAYSISEGNYRDIPCYEVSIKIPTDKVFVNALINKSAKQPNAGEFISKSFPFVKTYFVGKDNSFIYSCAFYNLEGKKTFSANWGNIDFTTPIDNKIFETPQGDIPKLDRCSEEFKKISRLFSMPVPDANALETNKTSVKKDNAKDILYDAKKFTEQASFKSKTPIYKDGKIQKTVNLYRKKQDNTIFEKVENIWPDAQKESYISNESSTYILLGNIAIKTDTAIRNRSTIYTSINKKDEKGAEYTFSDGSYNDIPCHKITVKLPKDKSSIDEHVIMHWRAVNDAQEYVARKVPFTKTYLVDKENHFIYSCEFYNMQNEKIFSANWGDIDFKTPIDSNIFAVPNGDVEQVDKNSDKIRYASQLFSMPSSDVNDAEAKKVQKTALAEESDKAREILFAAVKETEKTSFKATSVLNKGGKPYRTTTSYHLVTPDGILKERVENIWPNSVKEVYIANQAKTYVLINNTLVKADFKIGSRTFIYKNIKSDVAEDATYSMEDTIYKNIPCYKVIVKIPTDENYVNDRIKRVRRKTSEHEKILMDKLPFVKTFIVGQKNLFIYSCTFYNIMGRKTVAEEWGDIDFNAQMSNSLFEPPQGITAVFAQTRKDFDRIREKSVVQSK